MRPRFSLWVSRWAKFFHRNTLTLTVFIPGEPAVQIVRMAPPEPEAAMQAAWSYVASEAQHFAIVIRERLRPSLLAQGRPSYTPKLRIIPTEWGYDLIACDLDNLRVLSVRLSSFAEKTKTQT